MRLEKYLKWNSLPILLLIVASAGNSAYASLVFQGVANGKGAGIGGSNVVLTIQKSGSEQGCVAWNGTADVVGSGACPSGLSPAITGGDEKTGNSQTQTRTVTQTGVLTGSSLVVILNISEPAGGSFTISNVSVSIFSPTGSVLFNSGNMTAVPISIQNSQQGQGNLGFALVLDSTEAARANQFICTSGAGCSAANANNRFGLAGFLSGTSGGNETFSIADSSSVSIVPEPSTIATLGAGLLALSLFRRFQRGRGAA